MKYTTESELRKLTSKEALAKLRLAIYRPTEATAVINTENVLLDVIEKDLEVLEILKRIVKIVDYSKYPITSLDNQLVILSGGEIKNVEDYNKIKEWLKK